MSKYPSDSAQPPSSHSAHAGGLGDAYFDALAKEAAANGGAERKSVRWTLDVGNHLYDMMKAVGHSSLDSMGPAFRNWLQAWVRTPGVSDFFQGPQTIRSMRAISSGLEIGAHTLGRPSHGLLYEEAYNHKMLAEDGQGHIRSLNPEHFYKLFPPVSNQDSQAYPRWPRLVLTSHHARAGGMRDITSITHGIEAMMRQCFDGEGGRKHPPLYHFETGDFFHPQKHRDSGNQQLMIAYACDVEKDPFANGASLLERIDYLKKKATSVCHLWFGSHQGNGHRYISKSAYRLAKIILQCLVTEPERIDAEFQGLTGEQPNLDARPLKFRADAEMVAQHIALIGYSKGGNVVSDAMRLLVDELGQQRLLVDDLGQQHSQGLFEYPVKSRYHTANDNYEYRPFFEAGSNEGTSKNIASYLKNIPLLSLAAIEVPLENKYLDSGVRRVSINNKNDLISAHTPLRISRDGDEVIEVNGVKDLLGHAPKDALGNKKTKGYILNDEHARRRIEEFFCALYGAAAISKLSFKYDDQPEHKNAIIIESAAGTSNQAMLDCCPIIQRYLEQEGFTEVNVGISERNKNELKIRVAEPLFISKGREHSSEPAALAARIVEVEGNIQKLGRAFTRMRDEEPALVINAIVDDNIAKHLEHVQKQSGTWQGRITGSHNREISGLFDGTYSRNVG